MRLIDADALHDDFINDLLCIKFGAALQGTPRSDIDVSNVLERIEEAPTIEAEPVRHGKWEFAGDGIVGCTSCGETYPSRYVIPRNYCPNCGAKMDDVKEDAVT